MSRDFQLSPPFLFDWPSFMKAIMTKPDSSAPPQVFAQPILPGWVFGSVTNITEQNSSDPDTERAIVSAQSYGRQLGRIIDAVALLFEYSPEAARNKEPFKEFDKLRTEIDRVKDETAERRANRVVADLAKLKETKPDDYERLAEKLRAVLSES